MPAATRTWDVPPNPPPGFQWFLMPDNNWECYPTEEIKVHEEDFE